MPIIFGVPPGFAFLECCVSDGVTRILCFWVDAAATAHFSIGSGTKLAFESAIALSDLLHTEPDLSGAFAKYEDQRRLEILRLQSAARNSVEWFENVEHYLHLNPIQLNYSLLTRSQRISHENLRARDAKWLRSAEKWFQEQAGVSTDAPVRAPMFAPFQASGHGAEESHRGFPYGAV